MRCCPKRRAPCCRTAVRTARLHKHTPLAVSLDCNAFLNQSIYITGELYMKFSSRLVHHNMRPRTRKLHACKWLMHSICNRAHFWSHIYHLHCMFELYFGLPHMPANLVTQVKSAHATSNLPLGCHPHGPFTPSQLLIITCNLMTAQGRTAHADELALPCQASEPTLIPLTLPHNEGPGPHHPCR